MAPNSAKKKGRPAAADRFYKIGEVCAMTDTQPYVLRFWESEFPQLAPRKSRSGQRLYEQRDVDLVVMIKKLLYDEEYTIAGARKRLEELGYAPPVGDESEKRKAARPSTPRSSGKRAPSPGLRRLRKELLDLRKLLES